MGLTLRRDVSFYGNKLFQSTFIAIIAPGSSILTGLLWTLLNSFVALVRPPALDRSTCCGVKMRATGCQAHPSSPCVWHQSQ